MNAEKTITITPVIPIVFKDDADTSIIESVGWKNNGQAYFFPCSEMGHGSTVDEWEKFLENDGRIESYGECYGAIQVTGSEFDDYVEVDDEIEIGNESWIKVSDLNNGYFLNMANDWE